MTYQSFFSGASDITPMTTSGHSSSNFAAAASGKDAASGVGAGRVNAGRSASHAPATGNGSHGQ
jgi:hypothetical protein